MRIFVPPERRVEALDVLRTMQGRLEVLPECMGCWIQDRDSPCHHIVYAEQWESEEAIYEHIRSPLYRIVLAVLELSNRAPEVCIYYVSHTKGIELIKALRGVPVQAAIEES